MMRSITLLSLIALLASLFALAIGSVTIAPSELWQVVQGNGSTLHLAGELLVCAGLSGEVCHELILMQDTT